MRKIIAAFQVSVDGLIEGPNGEIDWINSWEDPFDLLGQIDTCVLGGKDMHAVGGATLVSSLINAGLIDELRLAVVPVVLGAGKPWFQGMAARRTFRFPDPVRDFPP